MTDPTPSPEAWARARSCAAQVFDALARRASHPEVAALNRSYATRIRAGEADDFDAVQSALLALTSAEARSRGQAEEREAEYALLRDQLYGLISDLAMSVEQEDHFRGRVRCYLAMHEAAIRSGETPVGEGREWRDPCDNGAQGLPRCGECPSCRPTAPAPEQSV